MAKQITFTYDGKDYTLEFTRRTVQMLEDEGFDPREVESKPMSRLPQLFAGAFKAHHRFVSQDTIDEIYSTLPNKSALMSRLGEMYSEPLNALLEEPTEEGKVNWTVTW